LATLNFKTGPVPGGGLYGYEMQRQMFPAVDNPLRQPYAAFGQGELLTILFENILGRYLGGKAITAISKAERARAEAAARDEVRAAVSQYCNSQPNLGAGIQICDTARD
jgi:nucleoid-associated protein YejK